MEGVLFSLALFVVACTDGVRRAREAREERMREYKRLAAGLQVDRIVQERLYRQNLEAEWAFLDEHFAKMSFGRILPNAAPRPTK